MPLYNKEQIVKDYSKIFGIKEETVAEYAEKKGYVALINNANDLFKTKTQKEKHKAFVNLYRMSGALKFENDHITAPRDIALLAKSVMKNLFDKESMVVFYLNTKNNVIDFEEISVGTVNGSIVHPRDVFKNAISNNATSIILCHNHPSGNVCPSKEDMSITQRVRKAGEIICIQLMDHVIVSSINDNYYSFRENNQLTDENDLDELRESEDWEEEM